jgi:transketolase
MPVTKGDLQLISTTIKSLTMDAVQKAKSGHPGMPMGCSDIAAVLWTKFLKHNPRDPKWMNRDRFILSPGHGSMLLYSLLHFTGYGLSLDDIKNFRQLHSQTPGHPEFGHTAGVETTTGPLGQGFSNGVGMAMAQELLAQEFNTDKKVIDHYIYAIVSDGDLMEGISAEAASIAGHLGLGKLIYIYDSNDISIEGDTNLTYSENTKMRFEACNWHVQEVDGHDFDAIEKAIINGQKEDKKPSIIIAKTKIAKGAANLEGSENSHGAPLGEDEVAATKEALGLNKDEYFVVPERIYEIFKEINNDTTEIYKTWQNTFKTAVSGNQEKKWNNFFSNPNIDDLRKKLPAFDVEKDIATRGASGKVLETLFKELPNIIGGSADLGPSNKSFVKGYSESGKNKVGRNIHFGIREHAMGAIQNGIAYYGGFIPYSATFFVFMDYMRPAIRLAALAKLNTIYIYTHDSVFVGEDGPTHQPVEHLSVARAIRNFNVIRPADALETAEAWLAALNKTDGPTMLSLSRQNLPVVKRNSKNGAENLHKGAYIIHDCEGTPDIIILSTGSEVSISIEAADTLAKENIKVRVVSFPCWKLFDAQSDDYKASILPREIPKAVVEAGVLFGWERYAGPDALFITIDDFGTSGPYKVLAEYFGMTAENIINKVKAFLK